MPEEEDQIERVREFGVVDQRDHREVYGWQYEITDQSFVGKSTKSCELSHRQPDSRGRVGDCEFTNEVFVVDEQYVWESQADGSFTVTRDTSGENLGKGTKITLFLKEDQLEYLEEHRLKDLINNYPKFISYRISLWVGNTSKKEISDDEAEEEKNLKFGIHDDSQKFFL
ncbi:hypothetical protein SLEP1_g45505 [Rubroshorea leprosula]|uniref:Uncharacterized protein n=1 Tax=Rubroshorea leprosula TaxID=152421 RepID=A0AAV5LKS9_9ROSI|nr:hypothetical protein SLEP1_g45505 [Rubroshorea leprosula]